MTGQPEYAAGDPVLVAGVVRFVRRDTVGVDIYDPFDRFTTVPARDSDVRSANPAPDLRDAAVAAVAAVREWCSRADFDSTHDEAKEIVSGILDDYLLAPVTRREGTS